MHIEILNNGQNSYKDHVVFNSSGILGFINKEFYTSGLGGIYPKNIKVGFLKEIVIEETTIVRLEIKLITNPLEDSVLGVIKY